MKWRRGVSLAGFYTPSALAVNPFLLLSQITEAPESGLLPESTILPVTVCAAADKGIKKNKKIIYLSINWFLLCKACR